MADCLIAVHCQKGKLASFDKKLLEVKGVKNIGDFLFFSRLSIGWCVEKPVIKD